MSGDIDDAVRPAPIAELDVSAAQRGHTALCARATDGHTRPLERRRDRQAMADTARAAGGGFLRDTRGGPDHGRPSDRHPDRTRGWS